MQLVDNWKKVVLENYANFTGRARRAEFWYYALATWIIAVILVALSYVSIIFWFAQIIFSLGVLVPGLAVAVRRLHDIGKSGAYIFVAFIPIVGAILLLVWWAQDSDRNANTYGISPKYGAG